MHLNCRHLHRFSNHNHGAPTAGDSLVKGAGNGGYDAKHYHADLVVDKRGDLDATSTMTATATQDLAQFNLDFIGFEVEKVTVNGEKAKFAREDGELIITPKEQLIKGAKFDVEVDYQGTPKAYPSRHAPVALGWNSFEGGSFVVSEPDGTRAWMPVNDHPTDKATFSFDLTVPKPYTAAANGVLTQIQDRGESRTFSWKANDEMAPYLSTVHVGDYVRSEQGEVNGVPIRNYFPPDIQKQAEYDFGRVPEMMEFFNEYIGDYPFEVYGNIVMDTNLGGAAALETQTLPLYDKGMVNGRRGAERVLVHELAHHWFGNAVSPSDWKDIWLNEAFASYGEMLWLEKEQGFEAVEREIVRRSRWARFRGGNFPLADPPAEGMFDTKIYAGGTVALHALRKEIGDQNFKEGLQSHFQNFKGKDASTQDFINTAETVSERDLTQFFDDWIYSPKMPPPPVDREIFLEVSKELDAMEASGRG